MERKDLKPVQFYPKCILTPEASFEKYSSEYQFCLLKDLIIYIPPAIQLDLLSSTGYQLIIIYRKINTIKDYK